MNKSSESTLSVLKIFLREIAWQFAEIGSISDVFRFLSLHPSRISSEVLSFLEADEIVRVPRFVREKLVGDIECSELFSMIENSPHLRSRITQRLFAEFCKKSIEALNESRRSDLLNELSFAVSYMRSRPSAALSANSAGWFLTHPHFLDALFFAPQLIPSSRRALLHHVPKTGGTSLNSYIETNIPDARVLYPCSSFLEMLSMGGERLAINIVNDVAVRPVNTLIYGGHFNLTDTLRREDFSTCNVVSLYGHPVRLLSSGLRHYLTIATSDTDFAFLHDLGSEDVRVLESIIRGGAIGVDSSFKDIVERVLKSSGYRAHFQNPLARWYLSSDVTNYDEGCRILETLLDSVGSFMVAQFPDRSCFDALGLESSAPIERENVSGIDAATFNILLGGDDWFHEKISELGLIGHSLDFYKRLLTY